ncbi:MAG: hypothetical protein AB7S92_23455 [Parvibaculaceae bacterium]
MPDTPQKAAGKRREPRLAPGTVQMVVVGALLLVVLSVIIEYLLGDFRGLNAGADFGLVTGIALLVALCAGILAAAFHVHGRKGGR